MSLRMLKLADVVYRWYLLRVLAVIFYLAPLRVKDPSYFPERKRKSAVRRYLELVWSAIKTGDYGKFYNPYGFDLVDCTNQKEYILEPEFWKKIIPLNYHGEINQSIILRDKLLFWAVMSKFGLPTPEVIAYIKQGHCYWNDLEIDIAEWKMKLLERGLPFFLKATTEACARSVYKVNVISDAFIVDGKNFDLESLPVLKGSYLVQPIVDNCELINAIQPNSLNTVRIVTLRKNGKIELLSPGGLRIGGGGSVDNWAAGGLYVGIDAQGCLQQYGFYKPGKSKNAKSDRQPQTGFVFKGTKLPYYDDIVALVKRAHDILSDVVTIGWDVALTPDGPVIVEGNDNWEISLMQIVAGGLRRKVSKL